MNTFQPDYAVKPGEILEEHLDAVRMSKSEFAKRCNLSLKHVSQIIHGKVSITPDTAICFEKVLGMRAHVWLNLEHLYQLWKKTDKPMEASDADWCRKFPYKELARSGFVTATRSTKERFQNLLQFFGISDVSAWEDLYRQPLALFRHSRTCTFNPHTVSVLLRITELKKSHDLPKFSATLLRASIPTLRGLTRRAPAEFMPELQEILFHSGVSLFVTNDIPATHVHGLTRHHADHRASILLTLRYRSDDHFWFALFHEIAHLLLHADQAIYVDCKSSDPQCETEADEFAADSLILRTHWQEFLTNWNQHPTLDAARRFAEDVGVSPGIVAGRLQHEKIWNYQTGNGLKRQYEEKDFVCE